jgi:pyruvate,orthophosphate dikinase
VYGNLNAQSGSGVAFTRNPASGVNELFGEYLSNAEGEEVLKSDRVPETLQVTELAIRNQ